MDEKKSVSSPKLPSIRSITISESISIASQQKVPNNPYNASYLLKRIRGEQKSKLKNPPHEYSSQKPLTINDCIVHKQTPSLSHTILLTNSDKQLQKTLINMPIYKRNRMQEFHFGQLKHKIKPLALDPSNKQYYNTIQKLNKKSFKISKGVTIGGWIGGLFELIFSGHNGCYNEYRGDLKCETKYGSLNVTTQCINIFYKNSILHDSPFICLCRFRNNSQGKYRDCEFLHAKIQYI